VGWVSFFMDVSSEMVYPLVPLFLTTTLHASISVVGVIEGIAESTASLLKLFSGALADRFGKNKLLMGIGYGLSTASRPALALAAGWGTVLAARFTDRAGKGIRTSPRDAIIAASTPPDRLGLAFGFHRALDTAGAVVGPSVALLLLAFWPADYRLVFWLSIVPALIAILLIVIFISPDRPRPSLMPSFSWSLQGFNNGFLRFLLIIGLFSLGNSSNAFLILKAQHVGLTAFWISAVYLIFNVTYVALSVPAGMIADRIGREVMVMAGFVLFALVYGGLALSESQWAIGGLFMLYGVYMGLSDGVQRAYIATLVPEHRKATGFGMYHMVIGIALLPANLIAGYLWDHFSSAAPFWFGSALAVLAAILFVSMIPRRRSHGYERPMPIRSI
jgi:MFS family permease